MNPKLAIMVVSMINAAVKFNGGANCPLCLKEGGKVTSTRTDGRFVTRYHCCKICKLTFKSVEVLQADQIRKVAVGAVIENQSARIEIPESNKKHKKKKR